MNLLVANGHVSAFDYPIGRVFDESAIIVEREQGRIATDVSLRQLMLGALFSKKGRTEFKKRLEALAVTTKPIVERFETDEE